MKGALSYNEHKVKQGKAEIIAASGFACDVENLGFSEKLTRFDQLIQNSSKVSTNTLHISLNFAPGESLDTETLQNIARDYMERIGFGEQPFLAYRHDDAAHPHIHIVTTPIKQNGRTINIHNIARRKSEPARKAIEVEYELIKAEGRKQSQSFPLKPIPLQAAYYAQAETKRAISNIVQEVVARYRYTSLEELNMILRQFNIMADRGSASSRMYQKRGLVYSMIDKDGYKIGVPIKASSIFTSPTLSVLEKKFEGNRVIRPSFQNKVQTKIFSALAKSSSTVSFMEKLKEWNIGCTVLYESTGTIKDISFVDHSVRTVFSCQDLGISPNELLVKLNHPQASNANNHNKSEISTISDKVNTGHTKTLPSLDLLKTLLTTEAHQPDISPEFFKKKRKKRSR